MGLWSRRAKRDELTHHLGYAPGGAKPTDTTNQRNGTSAKTVLTDEGPLRLEIPRDRDGMFEPQLIGKHERRFTGFDDKILALCARGLTVREKQRSSTKNFSVSSPWASCLRAYPVSSVSSVSSNDLESQLNSPPP